MTGTDAMTTPQQAGRPLAVTAATAVFLSAKQTRHTPMNQQIVRSCGFAAILLAPPAFAQAAQPAAPASQVLWYDSPAGNWESEALPIGNGRLGAMIFGAADKETIQINEDSLWLGDEKDTGMYQNLGEFEVALPRVKPAEHYRRELDISRLVGRAGEIAGGRRHGI